MTTMIVVYISWVYLFLYVPMLRDLAEAREEGVIDDYKGVGVVGANILGVFFCIIVSMILWTQVALVWYDPGVVTDEQIEFTCKKLNVIRSDDKPIEAVAIELTEKWLEYQNVLPKIDEEDAKAEIEDNERTNVIENAIKDYLKKKLCKQAIG